LVWVIFFLCRRRVILFSRLTPLIVAIRRGR
jgi:hypothetical protein